MIRHRMHDPEFTPEPAVIPRPKGWPEKLPKTPRAAPYKPSPLADWLVCIAAVVVIVGVFGFLVWLFRPSPAAPMTAAKQVSERPFGHDGHITVSADGKTAYLFSGGRVWEIRNGVAREVSVASSPTEGTK